MSNIQSVKRAFIVLNIIAAHTDGVNLTKISNQVDLPKSTVSRLLSTLESVRAVERLPGSKSFRIGPEILALGLQPPYLIAIARPHLVELAQKVNESIVLCFLNRDRVHYVDQVQSQHQVQIRDWTGSQISQLHIVSAGKIFLAYWPEEQQAYYLTRPLEQPTKNSISNPDTLRQHLAEIRAQGYAWSHEEYEVGVTGISVPILNRVEQVIAAVNITGPTFRFPQPGQEDEIVRLIVETGHQMSLQIKGDC